MVSFTASTIVRTASAGSLVRVRRATSSGEIIPPASSVSRIQASSAAQYGFGHSEEIVGRALAGLDPRPYVFTKGGQPEGPDRTTLQTHPRNDATLPLTGVFATRSPDRPNPMGLHCVTVTEIGGSCLRVGPIEAVDGTPVVDIKPVLRSEG